VAHAATPPGSGERARLREQLVAGYLSVAQRIARRYAGRGEPIEDLIQIASIGLINAIDRYDPGRGDHFLAFAVPTITGEVRRHFRDKTWSMRVPRRLKDLHVLINTTVMELSQRLGRAPRPSEIAASLDLPTDMVLEALAASQAYRPASLDGLVRPGGNSDHDTPALGEYLGAPDTGFELFTQSRAVAPYLAALPARERAIVIMRFYHDMTQTQIAEKIGISQMHVSRLLSSTLAGLRNAVITDRPVPMTVTDETTVTDESSD
jgi:RNA polymerase sigma-B factor